MISICCSLTTQLNQLIIRPSLGANTFSQIRLNKLTGIKSTHSSLCHKKSKVQIISYCNNKRSSGSAYYKSMNNLK